MFKTPPVQTGILVINLPNIRGLLLCATMALTLFNSSSVFAADPVCQSSQSDLDGDGWGWENNASCVAINSGVIAPECRSSSSDPEGDGWGWENGQSCVVTGGSTGSSSGVSAYPKCSGAGADPDGDGYGWEYGRSCQVAESSSGAGAGTIDFPACASGGADPDGDGYGWEYGRSCKVVESTAGTTPGPTEFPTCASAGADTDGDGFGWENGRSCIANPTAGSGKIYRAADITDLILVTGQSNTLGANTSVDYQLDSPHPRVFAYTSNGWRVAELFQTWDGGRFPGPGYRNASNDRVANNFALHFGKKLVELDANAVVGIVLVAEPGEGIENWDPGNNGMNRVQQKVTAAINELSHKTAIDGILWHQGETDWLYDGTADPDVAKPAPKYYYPNKLSQLINNFRLENWYGNQSPFICGETISAVGINAHLNSLNYDNDSNTACVAGYGLPSRGADGSHFDASGLRTIGQRYAYSYYNLSRN